MPIHHRKIDPCPVIPARKMMKQLLINDDKRRITVPSENDSEYNCPIHGTPYKLHSNGRIVFKGYDAKGNKIMEPYPKTSCVCNRCKREGLRYSFPLWQIEKRNRKAMKRISERKCKIHLTNLVIKSKKSRLGKFYDYCICLHCDNDRTKRNYRLKKIKSSKPFE